MGKQKKKPAKKVAAAKPSKKPAVEPKAEIKALKVEAKGDKKKGAVPPVKAAAKEAPAKKGKAIKAAPVPPAKVLATKAAEKPAKPEAKGKKGAKVARIPEPTLKDIQAADKEAAVRSKKGKGGKGAAGDDDGLGAGFDIQKISERALKSAGADGGCRETACETSATSSGYCRLHYIKNWKRIKRKELLLKEGKLNRYIEELVSKYPDKYIEAIRQDLSNDGEFNKVITELELDEAIDDFDGDADQLDNLIDSIRKDLDDESDLY